MELPLKLSLTSYYIFYMKVESLARRKNDMQIGSLSSCRLVLLTEADEFKKFFFSSCNTFTSVLFHWIFWLLYRFHILLICSASTKYNRYLGHLFVNANKCTLICRQIHLSTQVGFIRSVASLVVFVLRMLCFIDPSERLSGICVTIPIVW